MKAAKEWSTLASPGKKRLRPLPEWLGSASWVLAYASYFLLDFTLRSTYPIVEGIALWAAPPILFSALWALMFLGVAALLPRLARRIWLGVTFLLFAAECVAHAALYQLTGTVFSFATLAYAEDGAKFFSLAYLRIDGAEWAWLAGCLVLMAGAIVLAPKKRYTLRRVVVPAALIAVGILGITLLHHALYTDYSHEYLTWDAERQESSLSESYSRLERANECLMASGLYQFTWRSAMGALFPDNAKSAEQYAALDAYYAAHPKTSDSPYAGTLEGQNLILILMESIDTWMVTPEYMPNLYALMQESVSFSDYYAPIYIAAATFSSEFAVNTGLAAPTAGISNDAYATHSFPYALANLFENKGYTANSFHVSSPDVYNRGLVHKNYGFEAYHSADDMGVTNVFLDTQLVRAHEAYSPDEPFFSYLITYSCHGPHNGAMWSAAEPHWAEAKAAIDFDAVPFQTETDKSEYTFAVAQAMETDAFIGALMEQLEDDGHLEDTTVIFFGDHYAKYITSTEFVMALKDAPNRDLLTRVPFGIWSKALEPQVVDTPVSVLDVALTIASLFSLDADLRYYAGNDMLSSDAGLVPFVDGHWYDGAVYFDGSTYYTVQGWTDPKEETVLARLAYIPTGAATKTAEAAQRLSLSWRTFQSDYFAYLRKKS